MRPEIKYLPRYCMLLKRDVWAILTKQSDGTWRIVNCLDKDKRCFDEECAFSVDGGQWPFTEASSSVSPHELESATPREETPDNGHA